MGKRTLLGLFLILLGGILFSLSLVKITNTNQVMNDFLEVWPGESQKRSWSCQTEDPAKTLSLKGTVRAEFEDIYFSVDGRNSEALKNVFIVKKETAETEELPPEYYFTINSAEGLYEFIFDNTKGVKMSGVDFFLAEEWTESLSPFMPILGVIGIVVLLPIGTVLYITSYRKERRRSSRRRRTKK